MPTIIEDHAPSAQLPLRFAASKLIEGDQLLADQLKLSDDERQAVSHVIRQMEEERGLDASAAIADMRFQLIFHICDNCVVKPHESKERLASEKIDRILTGKWTAIPCFIAIMAAVFVLTFNVIGAWLQERLEQLVGMGTAAADAALTNAGVSEALRSLVIDGIFAGVGSVLSFMPIILVMFLFLSLLEDSGYLARVAFFMDKPLRKIGLSGRSIVPMLVGFGCTVPAVMSTRTLPSDRDRRMTILLTPFMSCTAKLPIYAFFVAAFFPGQGGLVMTALYLLGILLGILVAHFYNRTIFKGDPTPLVIELPNYRIPSPKNTGQLMWEKAKDFLQKAFSVILIATIVVWFLSHFRRRPQPAARRGGREEPAGIDRRSALADPQSRGPGRLAHRHLAHQRLHGQGERGGRDGAALRAHGRRRGGLHDAAGGLHAGVCPALHALRGRHGRHQAGAGDRLGRSRGRGHVRHGMASRIRDTPRRHGRRHGIAMPPPAGDSRARDRQRERLAAKRPLGQISLPSLFKRPSSKSQPAH